jgi:hypothetical protein
VACKLESFKSVNSVIMATALSATAKNCLWVFVLVDKGVTIVAM